MEKDAEVCLHEGYESLLQTAPTEHALKCTKITSIRDMNVSQIWHFSGEQSHIFSSADFSEISKDLQASDSGIAPGMCRNGCSQPSITSQLTGKQERESVLPDFTSALMSFGV